MTGGVVVDVPSNGLLADGLAMPHSPRVYDGKLYLLESATGNLIYIDTPTGRKETVLALNGFARGMDKIGDFIFIGLSQLRKKSGSFEGLPVSEKSVFCGVVVIHLPTARIVANLKYEDSVEEIYDVRIMKGMRRPGLVSAQKGEHRLALTTPDEDYWALAADEVNDEQNRDIKRA